ncbi:hypothetical protein B0H10DRAFT_2036190 [Mycena sp. CBHHK59/15]|nr:hypothetical protein B0H10DRAFT_2036190 [Mycena sp. CBHHK59/15]
MAVNPGTKESYIGVFLENIIYGVYLSVFVECCVILRRKHQTRNVKHIYLIVTTVLMFILITMRCVIDTVRCIVAFNNVGLDFGPPNTTIGLVTNACWFFVTAVADTFIIFRTFIVWQRNWFVIILPSMVCLANFGSSIWVIVALIEFDPEGGSVFENIVIKSMNSFISLTLCTNLICTGLISFRIFQIRRKVAGMVSGGSGRWDGTKVISIIVESAAMYTLLLTGSLISNSLNSYVNYILFNCTPPTIGVVFSYIIIRVSRGTSYGDSTANAATMSLSGERENDQTFELSQGCNPRSGTRSEVQVRLERVTHQHSDLDHLDRASKDDKSNIAKYPDASVV